MSSDNPIDRICSWLFLGGDRRAVTAVVLALFLVILLLVDPVPTATSGNMDPLLYAYSAILGGNLSLLVIVLSINQLVFSRQLESIGDLREEIDAIGDLREAVAASTDEIPPTTPAEFLRTILDGIRRDVGTVDGAVSGATDPEGDVAEFTADLSENLDDLEARLESSPDHVTDVLAGMLTLDLTGLSYRSRTLRSDHDDRLPEEALMAFDRIFDRLRKLNLTRNQFKSMYTQVMLSRMSRLILFVGLPAQAVLVIGLLWLVRLSGGGPPNSLGGPFVYATIVLGLAPLTIFFAFAIQAATITRQTATTLQFAEQKRT